MRERCREREISVFFFLVAILTESQRERAVSCMERDVYRVCVLKQLCVFVCCVLCVFLSLTQTAERERERDSVNK